MATRLAAQEPVRLATVALVLACHLGLAACDGGEDGGMGPSPVTITLSPASVSLFVGETATLSASVAGAQGATVSFSSSDSGVATVDDGGTVTAVAPGAATITASVVGQSGVTATAQVAVNPSTISLTPTSLDLVEGDTARITASVTGGSGHTVSWTSSSDAVATVDDMGLVTAIAEGSATITASVDGQPGVEATAAITVSAPSTAVELLGITKDGQPVDLADLSGEVTLELDVTVPPGFDGALELLLNEEVAATVPIEGGVVLGAPPAVAAADLTGASTRRQVVGSKINTREILSPIDVNSLPVQPRFPNDLYELTPQVVDQNSQIVLRGTSSSVTLNNRLAVVIVDGVVIGPSATNPVTNRTYAKGDLSTTWSEVSYDGSTLSRIDEALIERVEILSGSAASAVYGADAVAGVVNLVMKGDDPPSAGGLRGIGEGRFAFTRASIRTDTGDYDADILNYDAAFSGAGLHAGNWDLDFRGPVIKDRTFFFTHPEDTVPPADSVNFYMSATYQLDQLATGLRWSLSGADTTVTDEGVGVAGITYKVSEDGSTWLTQDIVTGADVGFETLDPHLRFRAYARDWLDQVDSIDAVQDVQTDFTSPTVTYQDTVNSEAGILDLRYNQFGKPLLFQGDDGAGSGFGMDAYTLRITRRGPGHTPEEECAVGDFDAGSGICGGIKWDLGRFSVDLSLTGEYRAEVRSTDRARYSSAWAERWFGADTIPPSASGLTSDDTLRAGQNITLGASFLDDLEIKKTVAGFAYQGVDTRLAFQFTEWGTEFDGQFDADVDAAATLGYTAFVERLATSGSGFRIPDGVAHRASQAFYGGMDHGGNVTEATEDVDAKTEGTFMSFRIGALGLDRVEWRSTGIQVCYNPYGSDGDCGGVPETVTTGISFYYPAGGVDPIDDFRFALKTDFGGFSTAFLDTQSAARQEQDFGSFRVVDWERTIDPLQVGLGPGTYTISGYGFNTTNGAALEMDDNTLLVVGAQFKF